MFEIATVFEENSYSKTSPNIIVRPPNTIATFYSLPDGETTTIILADAKNGVTVKVEIKKERIPVWVNTPEK